MAKYKLLSKAYINNQYLAEDTVIFVSDDFIPGAHMIPMDATAKKTMRELGIVPDAPTDYVDAITGQMDVTKFGASPQTNSGITRGDVEHSIIHGQEG